MNAKLVVAKGKTAVKEIPIGGVTTIIGRKTDCSLRIPSPLVSRQHCELTCTSERLLVKDLGSANGTFVNGAKVTVKELQSGDTLGVGPITFIVQLGDAPISPSDTARPRAAAAAVAAFETDEAADFVVEAEGAADDGADFVVAEEAPSTSEDADFVVGELDPAADEADFVVSNEALAGGDTVHNVNIAEMISADQSGEAAVAEPAEFAEALPAGAEPVAKKKTGLFGRLFKRKEKKKTIEVKSEATKSKARPIEKPAAASGKAPKASALATTSAPAAHDDAALDSVSSDDAATGKPKSVGDDELADFLMGLNEKDG